MIFRQLSLRRQVSVIGIAISVAIALSVPLLEAVRIHGEQQRAVVVRARNIAHALAGQVPDQGRLQAERLRLSELARAKDVGGGQSHRVLDMDGTVLVEGGRARRWPVLKARAPIQVRGETVGVVEVVAGLRPFLRQIGFAAVAGILLGLAAFFAACVLPLRIVDRKLRAMARVMAQQASTRAVLPSEALATLGREIRRPVRSAVGTASLLLATELSPEQRRHVEAIQECGDAVLELIGEVVGSCELEAGRGGLETGEFDLVELAEGVIDVVEPKARPRDLILVLSTAATLPARVSGDAARLRQVLLSLVGNAIRFTDRGAVVLKVFPCGGHDLIRFEVHDTGIGIPPETRNRLFNEPAEGAAPTRRRPRGAGLGLGICTRLVTAMGGDIGFESEPGEGSIFWFEVPLRAAAGTATVGASSVPVGARRRAVLLAPNGPGREGARELLTSLGFEVMAADAARVGDCDIAVIHHSALPQAPFSRRGKHAARPWLVFGFGALRWSGDVEGVVDGALKPSQLGHVLATIFDGPEQERREAKGRPQPRTLPDSEPARRLSSSEPPQRPERERSTLNRSHSDHRHVA